MEMLRLLLPHLAVAVIEDIGIRLQDMDLIILPMAILVHRHHLPIMEDTVTVLRRHNMDTTLIMVMVNLHLVTLIILTATNTDTLLLRQAILEDDPCTLDITKEGGLQEVVIHCNTHETGAPKPLPFNEEDLVLARLRDPLPLPPNEQVQYDEIYTNQVLSNQDHHNHLLRRQEPMLGTVHLLLQLVRHQRKLPMKWKRIACGRLL